MDTGKLIMGAGALAAAGAGIWYVKKKSTDTSTVPGTVADEFIPQMAEPQSTQLYAPETSKTVQPIVAKQEYSSAPTQSYVPEEQIQKEVAPEPAAKVVKSGVAVDPNAMVKMITALYLIQDEKKRKVAATKMAAALRSLSLADQRIVLTKTIVWYNSLAADKKREVINLFESIGLQSWASKLRASLAATQDKAEAQKKYQGDLTAMNVLNERKKSDQKSISLQNYLKQKEIIQKQEQNTKEAENSAKIKSEAAHSQAEVALAEQNKGTPSKKVIPMIKPSKITTIQRAPMMKTFAAPNKTILGAASTVATMPSKPTPAELSTFSVLQSMFNALVSTENEKFQYVKISAAYSKLMQLPTASQKKVFAAYINWAKRQPVHKQRMVKAIVQKIAAKYPNLRRLAA